MNLPTKTIPGAWLVVVLLWFVAGLNYLDRIMITTMRESLVEAIPMTDAQFGLLTSIFLWVYGAISPFAGFLADRIGRTRVIITSVLVWSAVTWLTGQARTFDELLYARALMGVSEACYLPAALALIADYHRGPTRSLANGIQMTGLSVGSALGGLGGWLAERHGWSFPFHLCGVIGVLYSGLLVLLLRDAPCDGVEAAYVDDAAKPKIFDAIASLFSRGSFLLLLMFWGLLGVSGWVVVGWMPTYLNEQFQLTQGAAGLSATVYVQGAALVGVLVGGIWADRWSLGNPRARILVSSIGLGAAAVGVLLAASSELLSPALIGLTVFGLTRAFTDANIMPILCQVCDSRYRATGFGILNLCAAFVGGASIYFGGALRDVQINLSNVFLFAAASLLLCAILLYFVRQAPTTIQKENPIE